MSATPWWKAPLRVIQFNLQVRDTPLMDVEKIVRETREMRGNTLCINAGGIYGWYPSAVYGHTVNEFMGGRDILGEFVTHCHRQDIRLFARFDFSLAEDVFLLQRPLWFLRNAVNQPVSRGSMRPGLWRHLYKTCPTGGFQREEVAAKILEEVLNNYDVDGIFFNANHSDACWCDRCREKYLARYGKPMPDEVGEFDPSWLRDINTECMEVYRDACGKIRPDVPLTRYYTPFPLDMPGWLRSADNIDDRAKTGDILCAEAQDVLSRGCANIPEWNQPAIRMKMGRTVESLPAPFGIIHTCPGMDWRHTGMPVAEYLYWTSQIPANGGQYWASITGFPDTNHDKRMLGAVADILRWSEAVENDMHHAKNVAQVLLLCDEMGETIHGWTEALMHSHILFDMVANYQVTAERLARYAAIIVPEGYPYGRHGALFAEYVGNGGRLLVEGVRKTALAPVLDLLGVEEELVSSESLLACYLRFPDGSPLMEGFGETRYIPLRGVVGYCTPKHGANVLATLIPPFAPLDSVGAPPERASLATNSTETPLLVESSFGKGSVLFVPFQAARLVTGYGMRDNIQFLANCVDRISGDQKRIATDAPMGVQMSAFEKDNVLLVHLINGIGQRPLMECVPCANIGVTVKIPAGKTVASVKSLLAKRDAAWKAEDGVLKMTVPLLEVWEAVRVEFK